MAHRSLAGIQDPGALGIQLTETQRSGEGTEKCPVCEVSKQTHISFPKETVRHAEQPFELVHVDLTGPIEVA